MEIAKNVALVLQALSVTILGLNFAGVRPDSLPRIFTAAVSHSLVPVCGPVCRPAGCFYNAEREDTADRQRPACPPALQKVDTIAYQGVTWDIVAPARHPLEKPSDYARRLPTTGEAKLPPKCLKCGVELEEKEGWI